MEKEIFGPFSFKFAEFCNIQIIGAAQSGKTVTTIEILLNRNKLFRKEVDKTIYFYQCEQEVFKEVKALDPSIVFVNNKEDLELELSQGHSHACLVIDDYLTETWFSDQKYIINFFVNRSHHNKCTVIYVSQMLPPKKLQVLTYNTHYFLFKKTFYKAQIMYFFRSINPVHWRFLQETYDYVTNKQKYSTFVLVNHADTPEICRVRDFVFPKVGDCVYVPK